MSSIDFYDRNSADFFARTAAPSPVMDDIQARFLARLPARGSILDAGCGSGRDALAFRKAGYTVTAFDGSAEMARLASRHTGLEVRHMRFSQMDWRGDFDGVRACASLLHLPLAELPDAFGRVRDALRGGGVFYASFKQGDGERREGERHFTDLTLDRLTGLAEAAGMTALECWTAPDTRPGTAYDWVSVLAERPASV